MGSEEEMVRLSKDLGVNEKRGDMTKGNDTDNIFMEDVRIPLFRTQSPLALLLFPNPLANQRSHRSQQPSPTTMAKPTFVPVSPNTHPVSSASQPDTKKTS